MGNDLAGLVALVTGATSGIGRATAIAYASAGAAVMCLGRRKDLGESLAAELRSAGHDCRFVQADVSREADVASAIDAVIKWRGALDIVVNNAATFSFGSVEECELDEWSRVMATNATGVFLTCRAAFPHLRRSPNASIINVASTHAVATSERVAAYAASKGAVVALTRQMAIDGLRDHIRVNGIIVGAVDTPMRDAHLQHIGANGRGDATAPLATPTEIAGVAVFLASPHASFVTGSMLVADGGQLARAQV